jgi:hypothetical protein
MSIMRAIIDRFRLPVALVDPEPAVQQDGLLGGPGIEMPLTEFVLDGNRASRRRELFPPRIGAYTRKRARRSH